MIQFNTTHHMASAVVLAATTIVFAIAVVNPVSSSEAPFGRDEAAVQRLMETAARHQQQQQLQNQQAGILGPGPYQFFNSAAPSTSSSLSVPAKKSANNRQTGGVSQWHSLNGMWGKRGGRFGGMQFDENDWDYAGNEANEAPPSSEETGLSAMVTFKDGTKAKRSWKSLNGAWGKRSDDMINKSIGVSNENTDEDYDSQIKQKRAWRKLNGAWGKRVSDWNGLKGMWGKRSGGGGTWNKLNGSWGKRSAAPPSSLTLENFRSD